MLSTFRSCRKKFEYSYIKKLAPIGESIHLAAGGAFAAACEAARNHQFISSPTKALPVDDLLHAAIGPFMKAWDLYNPGEDETKNHHNVFHAFETYITEYHPFTDPVQPQMFEDKPSTEFTFAIPLPINHPDFNSPFIFVGRFDLLGKFYDLPVILDEKTTSALGPYWLQQWSLRGQFLGYVWACQQLGYSINTAIIRGVALLKTQHNFVSVPVTYPQHLVDRWYIELLETLNEIIHFYKENRFAYNFSDACTSYGGCSFKELCLANDPTPWLSNFQTRIWSPVKIEEHT